MNGPTGTIALQSQNGRSLMEIGIVLNNHGACDACDDVGKQDIIRSQLL
jgi:hypothetical protein